MNSAAAISERRIITSAIATLIYQDQSYLENGIAFEDLIRSAASQQSRYSKKQLEIIINKELASGSLVKLHNGNLALGPADHDGDSSDSFKFECVVDSNTKVCVIFDQLVNRNLPFKSDLINTKTLFNLCYRSSY